MPNVSNVTAGQPRVAGAVFLAPVGSTAPEDAKTALAAAYKDLGFLSDAGVTNSNTPSVQTTKAWGGVIVLSSQTEKADTFKFALLETKNVDVKKFIYGDANVTTSDDDLVTTKATTDEPEEKALVFDMITRDGGFKRLYIPRCAITSLSDITYSGSAATMYEVTVTAFPDANGVTHIDFEEPKA